MIGLKFLLRIAQFLLYTGIAVVIIVVLWYSLSRLFRWMVDSIQNSNRDFWVWLRGKFKRKVKPPKPPKDKKEHLDDMPPFMCTIGRHRWGKWNKIGETYMGDVFGRVCFGCGDEQRKVV